MAKKKLRVVEPILVTTHRAKTELSKLLKRVEETGAIVWIQRNDKVILSAPFCQRQQAPASTGGQTGFQIPHARWFNLDAERQPETGRRRLEGARSDGNGDRESFYLTTTIGGVHVFKTESDCFEFDFGGCGDEIDYSGPAFGVGGEWRL